MIRLFALMALSAIVFDSANAAVIEDPFSDPDTLAGPTGCVQAHLHRLGYDPGPIDDAFGRSTKRAADRMRKALLPFHAASSNSAPVPVFANETASAWCDWFEEINPGGANPSILYNVRDTKRAIYVAIITLGQGAEAKLVKSADGKVDTSRPFFFQGDHEPKQLQSADALFRNYLVLNSLNYHVMTRPYGHSEQVRRQEHEWQFHSAAIRALGSKFGFSKYLATGHSGGGHLAIALGQLDENVSCAVAAASIVAVKEQYRRNDGFVPGYVRTQHDPVDHPLPEDVVFGLIYNERDTVLSKHGVAPFVDRQAESYDVIRVNDPGDIPAGANANLVYVETTRIGTRGPHMQPMTVLKPLVERICNRAE